MTRKEKKEAAAKRRREEKLELLEKLKAQYAKTKDFKNSVLALDHELRRRINNEPQRASELRQIASELSQSLLDGIEKAKSKSGD